MSQFRPDLSEYRYLVEALADKLNEQAIDVMSLTDAVKICIERAAESLLPPGITIRRKRKKYRTLEF